MNVEARITKLEKASAPKDTEINVNILEKNEQGDYIVDGKTLTRADYMKGIEEKRAAGETVILVGFDLDKV